MLKKSNPKRRGLRVAMVSARSESNWFLFPCLLSPSPWGTSNLWVSDLGTGDAPSRFQGDYCAVAEPIRLGCR